MIIQSIAQITSTSRPRYFIILGIVIDNCLHNLKTNLKVRQEILEAFAIKSALLTTYVLTSSIFRFCFRVESKLDREVLNLKPGRYLIVANHRRAADPYVILATLPPGSFLSLLPIRFFTANIYLEKWWQRAFLMSFGSFWSYSVEGKVSGVKRGLYLSDKGQSLLIFPEGKRNRSNAKLKLKVGAAYLSQRRDFTILPVFVDYSKKRASVSWGKPFNLDNKLKDKDLDALTTIIFDRVLQLSN